MQARYDGIIYERVGRLGIRRERNYKMVRWKYLYIERFAKEEYILMEV